MKDQSEQAVNSSFFKNLDVCCQMIADMIGEKRIAEWTNSDYINLSRQLARKTKIRLSESTLKRIFGKFKTSERYYPQKATRDALAQFIGYKDWDDFENRDATIPELDRPKVSNREYVPDVRNKNRRIWLMSATFLGLAFILTLIVLKPLEKKDVKMDVVQLVCLNPNGITPHSAIFKLVAKQPLTDSFKNFSIDFADGRSKRKQFLNPLLTHYYQVPGRYYPKLRYRNKVIDTGYVYLQTKGWSITGANQFDTVRVYPIQSPVRESDEQAIAVSAVDAFRAGVDTLRTFFVTFSNIKPTRINGDNYELSFQLQTSANRTGVRCSQVDVNIYGQFDQHLFSIFKPECTVWTSYQFSENEKYGEENDLRPFGHDFTKGGILTLRVVEKKVSLLINNKEVYTTNYQKSIGYIMGLNITFAGIGSFRNVQLRDLKSNELF
ncbi:hypothetical protein [Sphingobacterium detergens]|uniref:Uncharacterized protein n=1 Tax=Sphingobacterium detergens TaxID=1145106 RepID=A0A420BKK0_SPHD1|nr:hypothetical protein [Sphingobacterium detergens]RKE57145.1 hypothetical protein DFQ12_2022 [Sphingobacterium detergens]